MPHQITLLYAAVLAVILILLSLRVVLLRRRFRVGLGTGEEAELARAVRVQGNFCEYVPLAVILILLLESTGVVPGWFLHILGLALVCGRLAHGFFGLNRSGGVSNGRFFGTLLTWLVLAAGALAGLYLAVVRWLVA